VELGGKHDIVAAPTGERLAHDLLRLAARVHVGCVDEVDARIERAVDDPDRLVVVALAPRPEHHRAEAERAHVHAGVREGAQLHRAHTLAPTQGRDRTAPASSPPSAAHAAGRIASAQ
jgi:hypothetical protein